MRLLVLFLFTLCLLSNCQGQKSYGDQKLTVVEKISMPSVKGRLDHMTINLKDRVLYLAALGNNTVEVIDLESGVVLHSIEGVGEPQGVAYLPEQNEIAVTSGRTGDCVFFNASTFGKLAAVHLASDADNIRYDAKERKLYVGYGNGGIALIDAVTHKIVGDVKLPAHPESFQLDKKNNLLFANLPDDQSIAVIDLNHLKQIDSWKLKMLKGNFPMTLDTASNLVIVGCRHPAVLVALDSKTGKEVSRTRLVGDVDDLFYFGRKKEVLASGGEGYINIFLKTVDNRFEQISNIATRQGARTSLLVPSSDFLILANRADRDSAASITIYKIR